jgi:hypothetical protein
MRILTYIFSVLILALLMISSQKAVTYPSVSNSAFTTGEKLRYRVTYGFMDAGEGNNGG